jgi:hypothetical protein
MSFTWWFVTGCTEGHVLIKPDSRTFFSLSHSRTRAQCTHVCTHKLAGWPADRWTDRPTSRLHGVEAFFRMKWLPSHITNSQHFIEPKDHYCVHKSQPLYPIMNPVHTPSSCFFKIHFYVIPFTSGFSYWSLSFSFSYWNFVCASLLCMIHSLLSWPSLPS